MVSSRVSPLAMLLGAVLMLSSHVLAASAVLGIDLGTEYIKASLVKPGVPLDIVLTKDSRRKETSAVAFKPSRSSSSSSEQQQFPERLYGSDAMALAARFPGDVYPNLKTLLGLPANDPTVRDYAARHPALQLETHPARQTAQFRSHATAASDPDAWAVEELLAMELQNVQKNAEIATGDGSSVRSVVITVPPFYTAEEKRAVESAARMAGLNVLGLVSDGLAVGLNYATSRQFPNVNDGAKPEYHMVFDMGAGSTKASVLRFQSRRVKDVGKFNKTVQEAQLLGAGWDRSLGGDALNYLIVDDMVAQFVASKAAQRVAATEEGVRAHGRAIAKLAKEAERVRHVLSANQNTQASFEGLYEDVDFRYKITRADFEAMAAAAADRIDAAVSDALRMAGLDVADLDSVILHGGATRTPLVQKALEKTLGGADKLRSNVNSDEAAVFGAGFRAAALSPSFRVKEIRIAEGASYPAGLRWTSPASGKEHTQRLWSAISPIGGPAKEFTLAAEDAVEELSVSFYQQVGDDKRDVKAFTTKNLTATVAAIKEKHPSCVESGVVFRIAAKLRQEDGEVDIVKVAAECEAEAKEGFVDGVKNLFGFGGKKDQEPLGETETVVGDESTSSTTSTESSTKSESATKSSSSGDASATPAADDAKKTELISVPIEITLQKQGTPELTKEQFGQSKDRLKAFAVSDRARFQREEALNQLEAFTYKVRDLLEDEGFTAASTDAERSTLSAKSSAASEWLDEQGHDASRDEFRAKLRELTDLVSPVQKRRDEADRRPALVSQLRDTLAHGTDLLTKMRKAISDYEAAAAASGQDDDLEDDDKPSPPPYTAEDLTILDTLTSSTTTWLADLETQQDALPPTADPVLLSGELIARRQKIDTASKNLALLTAKNKSKKASAKKGSGSSKTASAPPSGETIEVNGKSYTPEELEDMINNMTEDDWKIVEQQAARQKAENDKAKEEGHDEL